MISYENAHLIEAEELKEFIEQDLGNPTIERMMFIEAKPKSGGASKVFPCYFNAWAEDEDAKVKADPGLRFLVDIVQFVDGEFKLLTVQIRAHEIGLTKRIWDKPPTKSLREETPWVEKEVQ